MDYELTNKEKAFAAWLDYYVERSTGDLDADMSMVLKPDILDADEIGDVLDADLVG